jgi:serine/threonine protein kinase
MTQITPVTITVPKDADESNSVNYKISCARGDGDLAEHNASKEIGYHPNLVGSLGTINPGRRININEHFEGVDLEELVKTRGPIKDKTISREITRQILSGLSYMHERGYLHGDIKPSNVFVNTELDQIRDSYDTVKIADFQTAMKKTQVLESSLPPRGAAKYAHRSLLNATATGQPAKASERTDIYSFGATLCFMLTGKQPSNYRVIEDENGREHSIDEKRFRLSLYDGTQKLTEITAEKEEERIKDLVKNVPLSERMLVYRCMTDKEGERFETFEQIKAYLKNPVYAQTKYLGKRILQRFSSS